MRSPHSLEMSGMNHTVMQGHILEEWRPRFLSTCWLY